MLVFPAINLMGGEVVWLEQGRPETAKVFSTAPWDLARSFAAGALRLHVVDLDAAFTGRAQHNQVTIKAILSAVSIEVEVGGGIRTVQACERLFTLGAKRVVMGTAAIKSPEVVVEACQRFPRGIIVAVTRARAASRSRDGPRTPASRRSRSARRWRRLAQRP